MTKQLPETISEIISDLTERYAQPDLGDVYKCMVELYGSTFTVLGFAIQMEYAAEVAAMLDPLKDELVEDEPKPEDKFTKFKTDYPYNYCEYGNDQPKSLHNEYDIFEKTLHGELFIFASFPYDTILYPPTHHIMVISVTSGELIVSAPFYEFEKCGAMRDPYDIEGLRQYLVHIGELLNSDVLIPYEPGNPGKY